MLSSIRPLGKLWQRLVKALTGSPPAPLPQLLMWYAPPEGPVLGDLAAGYRLRTYAAGDEAGWAALLEANGQLGSWDEGRARQELDQGLVQQAQFFVAAGESLVSTTGVYDRLLTGKPCWEIGWVAVHPAHQGKALGPQVVGAAVRAALALPRRPIGLRTDDFRLPAIKVYLRLGFVPDGEHPSYPGRWQAIFAQLGEEYARFAGCFTRGSILPGEWAG